MGFWILAQDGSHVLARLAEERKKKEKRKGGMDGPLQEFYHGVPEEQVLLSRQGKKKKKTKSGRTSALTPLCTIHR